MQKNLGRKTKLPQAGAIPLWDVEPPPKGKELPQQKSLPDGGLSFRLHSWLDPGCNVLRTESHARASHSTPALQSDGATNPIRPAVCHVRILSHVIPSSDSVSGSTG